MSEKDPFFRIGTGDGEMHEVNQDNATVYNHLGRLAIFDHVFVTLSENSGVYVWKHNPAYEALAARAVENACILHLNLQEVSEVDMKAYMRHVTADLESSDTIPENWE